MMLFLLIVSLYFYCMFLLAEMFRTMLNNDDSRHYRFFMILMEMSIVFYL